MADWKDALAALGGTLPPGDPEPETTSQEMTEQTQKTPLHVVVERKGRAGKTATIIEGFECSSGRLGEVAKSLRHSLGTGGSARGGEILLQGDCREKAVAALRALGYRVK